jgi:hypothetical protein
MKKHLGWGALALMVLLPLACANPLPPSGGPDTSGSTSVQHPAGIQSQDAKGRGVDEGDDESGGSVSSNLGACAAILSAGATPCQANDDCGTNEWCEMGAASEGGGCQAHAFEIREPLDPHTWLVGGQDCAVMSIEGPKEVTLGDDLLRIEVGIANRGDEAATCRVSADLHDFIYTLTGWTPHSTGTSLSRWTSELQPGELTVLAIELDPPRPSDWPAGEYRWQICTEATLFDGQDIDVEPDNDCRIFDFNIEDAGDEASETGTANCVATAVQAPPRVTPLTPYGRAETWKAWGEGENVDARLDVTVTNVGSTAGRCHVSATLLNSESCSHAGGGRTHATSVTQPGQSRVISFQLDPLRLQTGQHPPGDYLWQVCGGGWQSEGACGEPSAQGHCRPDPWTACDAFANPVCACDSNAPDGVTTVLNACHARSLGMNVLGKGVCEDVCESAPCGGTQRPPCQGHDECARNIGWYCSSSVGECCAAQTGQCANDNDCCDSLVCNAGKCETASVCLDITQQHCSAESDCCEGMVCSGTTCLWDSGKPYRYHALECASGTAGPDGLCL